jgi:hypothetical protein
MTCRAPRYLLRTLAADLAHRPGDSRKFCAEARAILAEKPRTVESASWTRFNRMESWPRFLRRCSSQNRKARMPVRASCAAISYAHVSAGDCLISNSLPRLFWCVLLVCASGFRQNSSTSTYFLCPSIGKNLDSSDTSPNFTWIRMLFDLDQNPIQTNGFIEGGILTTHNIPHCIRADSHCFSCA